VVGGWKESVEAGSQEGGRYLGGVTRAAPIRAAEEDAENTMRIKRTAIVLALAGFLFGQDAGPPAQKKGGGRGPRLSHLG